jgi:hypothetical protein
MGIRNVQPHNTAASHFMKERSLKFLFGGRAAWKERRVGDSAVEIANPENNI